MKIVVNQMSRKAFCVFTSAGDVHNILYWLPADGKREWSLIVAFYGDSDDVFNELLKAADVVIRMKGSKFQNLKKILNSQPGLFRDYQYIWVADDDLTFQRGNINKLFEIARQFAFVVCQPAFSHDGRKSHEITMWAGADSLARIVNFVEVTCPLFQADMLLEFMAVYDGNLVGWGIDWWFCQYLRSGEARRFAVIDAVTVLNPHDHQRKSGNREITKLLDDGGRMRQWEDVKIRFGLHDFHQVEFARISEANRPAALNRARMTNIEQSLFDSFAKQSKSYFEFGDGAAACLAARHHKASVTVICWSASKLKAVREYCGELRPPVEAELVHVDLGPTNEWGFPVEQEPKPSWRGYHEIATSMRAAREADLFAIRGRFRVACFMQALLLAKPGAVLMVMNFNERAEYHVIREVAAEVAAAGNLSIFLPLQGISRTRIQEILEAYKLDPR